LGLTAVRAPDLLREHLALGHGAGLVVDDVVAGSSADTLGFKRHDVLISIDDQLLLVPEQLVVILSAIDTAAAKSCTLIRGGKRLTLPLDAPARPAAGTAAAATPPTASAINAGQTLADSNLTGGNASVAGTFAFATPSFAPSATGSQVVVFTPTDAANYTTANTSVTVTVNPAQDSTFDTWTGGNVTMTPAILQTYAIGGGNYNGTVAPQAPVTTVASGNLTLTAIVRTDDPALTVIGEHKTDLTLGTWNSLGNGTATGVDQTGVPTGNQRRAFTTPADGTKKFLRLRADYTAPN
jgi:hypothetical protein